MRNRKMLWIILGLVAAVVVCGGVVIYLLMSRPVSGPEPEDPGIEDPLDEEPEEIPDDDPDEEAKDPEAGEDETQGAEETAPETPAVPAPGEGEASTPPASAGSGNNGGTNAPSSSTVAASVGNLVIDRTGTNDGAATVRNLYINTTPVTIKNKTVQGDIIVDASAGNGDIVLENISCDGNIFLSGGSGKVTLRGVTAQGVVANKTSGTQNIIYAGQTSVPDLWVMSHVTVDESGLSNGFGGVSNIISESGGRIWNEVTLKGAQIDNITTTTPTNIEVPTGSTVQKVTAGAQTHVSGKGTVRELTVSSDQVTYENKPVHVTESGGRVASQSSGAIGTEDYGVQGTTSTTSARGSTSSSSSSSASRKLTTPTEIEIYTKDDGGVYLDFKGDSKASEGHVVTVNVGGSSNSNRVNTIELSRSQTSNILILNNAENDRNRTLRVSIYSKAVSNKYARSDTASAGNITIRAAGGFDEGSLRIEPVSSNSSSRYKFSWDPVVWEGQSSKVSKTDYTVEYRVNGGTTTTRTVTGSTNYTMPNAVDLGSSGSIWVRVTATVDEDSFPVVVDRTRSIETTFAVGALATPTGLTVTPAASGYGFTASWDSVANASGYVVTPVINGTADTSVNTTATTYTFTNISSGATSLGFRVQATTGSTLYNNSAVSATATASVPVTLGAPTGLSFDSITNNNRNMTLTWDAVDNAARYQVVLHYRTEASTQWQSTDTSPTGNSASFTGLPADISEAYFTVAALASTGWYRDSSAATSATVTLSNKLETPVVNLTVSNNYKRVEVTWNAIEGADSYSVRARYIQTGGNSTSEVFTVTRAQAGNAPMFAFDISPATNTTAILAEVQALPATGSASSSSEWGESARVSVRTVTLSAPTNFGVQSTSSSYFPVTWQHGPEFDESLDEYWIAVNSDAEVKPTALLSHHVSINASRPNAYTLSIYAKAKDGELYRNTSSTYTNYVVYYGNHISFNDDGFYLPPLTGGTHFTGDASIRTINLEIRDAAGGVVAEAAGLTPETTYDGSGTAFVKVELDEWTNQRGTVHMTITTSNNTTYTVVPFSK